MGRPYASSICSIFYLYLESNILEKFMNNSVTLGFFACTPLMIWCKVRILNLCNYTSKSYASVVLSDSEVTFVGEGEDVAFYPFLYCVLFIDSVAYSKKYVIKFPCLTYLKYFIETYRFFVFPYFQHYIKFFLHKLS